MIQPINNQEFYALVAPDGNIQPSTLAEDEATCMGFLKLMHKAGMGMSWHELKIKGFTCQKVRVTITA
jgi:hypothetical protein